MTAELIALVYVLIFSFIAVVLTLVWTIIWEQQSRDTSSIAETIEAEAIRDHLADEQRGRLTVIK